VRIAAGAARPPRRASGTLGSAGLERIFGPPQHARSSPDRVQERADEAWKDGDFERLTPHACRHTFASLMIAAGVNAKALSTFMGHANISITLDRYGHLMPGSEEEAAGLLDAYLTAQRKRAEDQAREAGAGLTGAQAGAQLGSRKLETAC
jgi:integrase